MNYLKSSHMESECMWEILFFQHIPIAYGQ